MTGVRSTDRTNQIVVKEEHPNQNVSKNYYGSDSNRRKNNNFNSLKHCF